MSTLHSRASQTGRQADTNQPGANRPDAHQADALKQGAGLGRRAKQSSVARLPTEKQITGQSGEDQALAFLLEQGLSLVTRNFRCKMGEIDLIMRQRQTLVFVEVRKRAPGRYGSAADSITHAKQHKLLLAAQLYLQRFASPPACRFDVIAIDGGKLDWIQNAIES